jgi:hypothetical protein
MHMTRGPATSVVVTVDEAPRRMQLYNGEAFLKTLHILALRSSTCWDSRMYGFVLAPGYSATISSCNVSRTPPRIALWEGAPGYTAYNKLVQLVSYAVYNSVV